MLNSNVLQANKDSNNNNLNFRHTIIINNWYLLLCFNTQNVLLNCLLQP